MRGVGKVDAEDLQAAEGRQGWGRSRARGSSERTAAAAGEWRRRALEDAAPALGPDHIAPRRLGNGNAACSGRTSSTEEEEKASSMLPATEPPAIHPGPVGHQLRVLWRGAVFSIAAARGSKLLLWCATAVLPAP